MSEILSQAQQRAVAHLGSPTLVAAGAGSGKTRTLTAKIAHLVGEHGHDPGRILAITFTNKAANEMKSRLEKVTGRPRSDFPWVRTFHSACLRILHSGCHLLGYQIPVQIYSVYHQREHLKKMLREFDLDADKYLRPVGFLISRAKNSGAPREHLAEAPRPRGLKLDILQSIYYHYNRTLKEANAVDFDDLLLLTRDLLRDHDNMRREYRELFQYILVDEYQDENDLQEEILRLLVSNGNLFAVGDDYQAIYGFRGANVKNFLEFEKNYRGATVFKLEENYRCASEIVDVAERLIQHNRTVPKTCFSNIKGGRLEVEEFYNDDEEAAFIVKSIRHLHQRLKIPYGKIAILYRTNFLSLPFERALQSRNIPYFLKGDRGFFERREILDINCYLNFLLHPRDPVSFNRMVNTPKRGLGPKTVAKIVDLQKGESNLMDACREAATTGAVPPKARGTLEKLVDFLESLREEKPVAAMERILKEGGYEEYMKQYSGGEHTQEYVNRKENLEFLLSLAAQKETLEQYLDEVTLNVDDQEDKNAKGDRVTLSTVHGAKGLEWTAVFVVGVEEEVFPHWRALGDGVEGIQEERRLMYVAMTRAERHLYLTYTEWRGGKMKVSSRFLDEAGLEG